MRKSIISMGLVVLMVACVFSYSIPVFAKTNPQALIVDTDLGIDDFIALTYLLGNTDVELKAISVECDGVTHCQKSIQNLNKLLQFLHHDRIPIGKGGTRPLSEPTQGYSSLVMKLNDDLPGTDLPLLPLKGQTENAVELLASSLKSSQSSLDILALGPLTNLAELLIKYPALKSKIKRIYIMGGAVKVPGNINDVKSLNSNNDAEWNIYMDAKAASIIFKSGIAITLIPLDLSNQVPLDQSLEISLEKTTNPYGRYTFHLLQQTRLQQPKGVWFFWDPLAAVIATQHNLASCGTLPLDIHLQADSHYAATEIQRLKGAPVQVCNQVDSKEFKVLLKKSMLAR
jgi:pyrimidine-specific ribonucleoside hydrolase